MYLMRLNWLSFVGLWLKCQSFLSRYHVIYASHKTLYYVIMVTAESSPSLTKGLLDQTLLINIPSCVGDRTKPDHLKEQRMTLLLGARNETAHGVSRLLQRSPHRPEIMGSRGNGWRQREVLQPQTISRHAHRKVTRLRKLSKQTAVAKYFT